MKFLMFSFGQIDNIVILNNMICNQNLLMVKNHYINT